MTDLLRIPQRQFVLDIVEEDVHTNAFSQNTQLGSDMAVTNNAQFFTTRFKTAHGLFIPFTAMRTGIGRWNAA